MNIPKLVEIARSWKIATNPTPEQQAVAEERLSVCDQCPSKEFKALIMTYTCAECGCPLSKKIYTPVGPSGCPLNKWER